MARVYRKEKESIKANEDIPCAVMDWDNFRRKKKKSDYGNICYVFDELPDDLLIEILRRVPANSLVGLQCVSKSWFRFITAHCFSKANSRLRFGGLVQRLDTVFHDRIRMPFWITDRSDYGVDAYRKPKFMIP
ncbi:F-box domain containing protein [Trema orientale]|uniref:F-box domain containing protein n=1 Tax=Trema orientale TaxID=63057 RepID=A0A2P5FJ40_TREOI|nr:F-box domain containing protein [Trema orientale]